MQNLLVYRFDYDSESKGVCAALPFGSKALFSALGEEFIHL
jgi:hypothetical protein